MVLSVPQWFICWCFRGHVWKPNPRGKEFPLSIKSWKLTFINYKSLRVWTNGEFQVQLPPLGFENPTFADFHTKPPFLRYMHRYIITYQYQCQILSEESLFLGSEESPDLQISHGFLTCYQTWSIDHWKEAEMVSCLIESRYCGLQCCVASMEKGNWGHNLNLFFNQFGSHYILDCTKAR